MTTAILQRDVDALYIFENNVSSPVPVPLRWRSSCSPWFRQWPSRPSCERRGWWAWAGHFPAQTRGCCHRSKLVESESRWTTTHAQKQADRIFFCGDFLADVFSPLIPTTDDAVSVNHEVQGVASDFGYSDAQQLCGFVYVPQPDLLLRAGCKQFRCSTRKKTHT